MSADFLARAAASLGVTGLFFVFIHLLTGGYPPLVIGLVYLAVGPGVYVLLFGALFVVDACLACLNLWNLFSSRITTPRPNDQAHQQTHSK